MAVRAEPGQTLCSTWDLTDWEGNAIRIGLPRAPRWSLGPTVATTWWRAR